MHGFRDSGAMSEHRVCDEPNGVAARRSANAIFLSEPFPKIQTSITAQALMKSARAGAKAAAVALHIDGV